MIRIPSHVISVAPRLVLLAWRITSMRAPDGPGDGQLGQRGSLPCPVLQHPSFSDPLLLRLYLLSGFSESVFFAFVLKLVFCLIPLSAPKAAFFT